MEIEAWMVDEPPSEVEVPTFEVGLARARLWLGCHLAMLLYSTVVSSAPNHTYR